MRSTCYHIFCEPHCASNSTASHLSRTHPTLTRHSPRTSPHHRFSFINVTLAAVFLTVGMAVTSLPFEGFLILTGLGLMMMASVNPINYAVSMWSVPLSVR